MKTSIVLAVSMALLAGCSQEQQTAMMGTLLGTAVGALSSKENSKRNALIGGAAGLFGGMMVAKNRQQPVERPIIYQQDGLAEENQRLRQELNQYKMQKEIQYLRLENQKLRDKEIRVSRGACQRGIF